MHRLLLAMLIVIGSITSGQERPTPPLPPDTWSGTDFDTAAGVSLDPQHPFSLTVHAALTPAGKACSNELNRAIYRQDVVHAFESRAHFDNCAFDEALAYVDERLIEADGLFAGAEAGDTPKDQAAVLAGMLELGRVLHVIQDFYAHSNYVEWVQTKTSAPASEADIPVVPLWLSDGRKRLATLRQDGLVSGRVWWSLPHRCSPAVPEHAQLAKDSLSTPAGKQPSRWSTVGGKRKIPNHTVAFNLARRATEEFLVWSAQRWPVIRRACGVTLKFIVQPDRRNDVPEAK